MRYSDLSDKERYDVIRLGVQNGITSLDAIEKAYNEYAEGGRINNEYYNDVLLKKDEKQKENIKEQLEERRTYADGGKLNSLRDLFYKNPLEAKKYWDNLSNEDKKSYGVEGGFWNIINKMNKL